MHNYGHQITVITTIMVFAKILLSVSPMAIYWCHKLKLNVQLTAIDLDQTTEMNHLVHLGFHIIFIHA